MTFLTDAYEPILPLVSPYSPWAATFGILPQPASAAFEAANRTIYFPIHVPTRCLVRRVWWANGATTSGGATITSAVYADVGNKPGRQLVAGSATQNTGGGAEAENKLQFVDVTDRLIVPGLYWIAIASTSATNTMLMSYAASAAYNIAYQFQEATGTPPTTATVAEAVGARVYLFGFSTDNVA